MYVVYVTDMLFPYQENGMFIPLRRILDSCLQRFVSCPSTHNTIFVFTHTQCHATSLSCCPWLCPQLTAAPTLVAFFMNLALSFSMSCHERMGVFSSSPTTMPGPCVGGPPVNSIILAPVFGNVP